MENSISYGAKFDRSLDTAEIAKRFRTDVKVAQKAGQLPAELKLSVRTERFAGGSAIRVTIKSAGFPVLNGTDQAPELLEPLATITTRHRFGLVTVHGVDYAIVDIGMRMLTPRELFRAQGFRPDYVIDPMVQGKPLTKTSQVRMCGNSVPPALSAAIAGANYVQREEELERVAHRGL